MTHDFNYPKDEKKHLALQYEIKIVYIASFIITFHTTVQTF